MNDDMRVTSRFVEQCDGSSLELSKGVALQGVALLNIPYAHGGSNLWGASGAHRRGRFPNAQQGQQGVPSALPFWGRPGEN